MRHEKIPTSEQPIEGERLVGRKGGEACARPGGNRRGSPWASPDGRPSSAREIETRDLLTFLRNQTRNRN